MSLFGSVADAPLKRGGARRGVALYVSEGALATGTKAFATPFRTVLGAVATIKSTTALATTMSVTVQWSANVVTVYGWKATSSSVTTLIAATGTDTVEVAVFGIY